VQWGPGAWLILFWLHQIAGPETLFKILADYCVPFIASHPSKSTFTQPLQLFAQEKLCSVVLNGQASDKPFLKGVEEK
jgi:hypothetical protein